MPPSASTGHRRPRSPPPELLTVPRLSGPVSSRREQAGQDAPSGGRGQDPGGQARQLALGLPRVDAAGAVGLRLGDDAGLVAQQGQPTPHEDVRRLAALGEVSGEASQRGEEAVLAHAEGVGEQALRAQRLDETAGEEALGEHVVVRSGREHVPPGDRRRPDVVDGHLDAAVVDEPAQRLDRGVGVPRVHVVPVGDADGGAGQVRVVVLAVEVVEPDDGPAVRGARAARASRLLPAPLGPVSRMTRRRPGPADDGSRRPRVSCPSSEALGVPDRLGLDEGADALETGCGGPVRLDGHAALDPRDAARA